MENAGRGLADVTMSILRLYDLRSVLVVAGGGNNGGDGLVAARHLRLREVPVGVLLACQGASLPPESDAGRNLRAARAVGIPVFEASVAPALAAAAPGPRTLLVDAVLGTGLEGPVRGHLESVLRWMVDAGRTVVAADLPSGLDADTGECLGPVPACAATATFLAMKRGLTVGRGPELAGRVTVCDIGVPVDAAVEG
jgi:NAD(P)H-hydrate epimerase